MDFFNSAVGVLQTLVVALGAGLGSRNSKSHYGIGLYAAASIAKKHGGKIILENSAVASGAKVTIQIPY